MKGFKLIHNISEVLLLIDVIIDNRQKQCCDFGCGIFKA